MDEQRLERALRQGPPFATEYVASSLALEERPFVRDPLSAGRLVLIMTVTALLLVGLLAGLVAVGRLQSDVRPVSNGWIAFARFGTGPRGPDGWVERDVYLVREGQAAHRIVGSDTDSLDQVCPAFSPDGRRLAHGEADGTADAGYHDAALVISDLDPLGNASESLRIDVGGTASPPCAVWSADGRRVAFGVGLTSPASDRSAAGSEVRVARVADGHVDVVLDMPASDLEWSPDDSRLAIAIGQTDGRQSVGEGSIRIYDADRGDMRTLVDMRTLDGPGPTGVWSLTWAPDGSRIAYQRGRSDGGSFDQEIWVAQVDGSGEHLIARGFGSVYGVGPVWSPAGDRIVYQRMKGGGEAHDAVLVTPDDGSEVVLPDLRLPADGPSVSWRPSSVTWSPDGRQLLYSAWSHGEPSERKALIARPLDPASDPVLLTDGIDRDGKRSWGRLPPAPSTAATASPSTSVGPTTSMWPQSTLEEVRQAQELADARDPRYTWQLNVDAGQLGQNHPCSGASNGCWSRARNGGSGEIFTRFLEEALGWEAFRWDEAFAHPDGLNPGDVVFVRCAPGRASPLYPKDPEDPGCAPTLDELRYETVKVSVGQPDREGVRGVWVVTGWEMIEPAEQIAPPSDAETTALVDAFLRARIDRKGAEGFADLADNDPLANERAEKEIPLLYATSTGASYERSEFELVDGPVWPSGQVQLKIRLFAEDGATVVEQLFSLERDESARLRLVYEPQATMPDGQGAATTENGRPRPVEYGFLDGKVTYRAAEPLEPSQDGLRDRDRLAIVGLLPNDDAPREVLLILADPRPIGRPGCGEAPAPADAEALARSIGSGSDFEATDPVEVTIGGIPGLRMDVVLRSGARCPLLLQDAPFGRLNRARLYLVDLPGASARVLAMATITDDDSFETVLKFAAPIVDSIEFHTP